MATKDSRSKRTERASSSLETVETFLAALEHPSKPEILALRQIILGADPRIAEGVKWNAPSFRTAEYFATIHLGAKSGVQVILHLGAKTRRDLTERANVADPESLLRWLADDRAVVSFRDLDEVESRRSAFANVIRQWIEHV